MTKRLGRGLDALIPSLDIDEKDQVNELNISKIRPNPYQPRKHFDENQLAELTESIKEHGVIQPIIVRKSLNGYEIVAGERRWRASKALNKRNIPAVIREFTDEQIMEIALIENIQREDLNPIEIATAYEKLMKKFDLTQEELAKKLGKSRPNVANLLRLLQLPESVLSEVATGKLSMGHARALITLEDEKQQIFFINKVINDSWSVRYLEERIKQQKGNVSRETKIRNNQVQHDTILIRIEDQLRDKFSTSVKIKTGKGKGKDNGKGKIEIEYFSKSDLERILEVIGVH